MIAATSVLACRNRLGEGPIWSVSEQALYWVDIVGPAIHRLAPATGEHRSWPMPEHVGSIGLRAAGGLVVALKSGFGLFDPASGQIEMINHAEADRLDNRFNDGRCDRAGRFFAGSLTYSEDRPEGALWRLEADHTAAKVLTGLTVPNGLCWSPDGATMYFVDTPTRKIMAYDYDLASGTPDRPRLLVEVHGEGWPDGSCTDCEGGIWNAEWDGGRVVRYRPDGQVDQVVTIPARRATCCAFGGPDLKTLYITSAWDRLSTRERAQFPESGNLFAVELDVAGLPEATYAG